MDSASFPVKSQVWGPTTENEKHSFLLRMNVVTLTVTTEVTEGKRADLATASGEGRHGEDAVSTWRRLLTSQQIRKQTAQSESGENVLHHLLLETQSYLPGPTS